MGGTASGAGLSPWIEGTPFIAQGAVAGAPVSLVKPPMKAVFATADYGAGRAVISEGGTFSFVQTKR